MSVSLPVSKELKNIEQNIEKKYEDVQLLHSTDTKVFDKLSLFADDFPLEDNDEDDEYDLQKQGLVVIYNFRNSTVKNLSEDKDLVALHISFNNLQFEIRDKYDKLDKKAFMKKVRSRKY